MKLFDIELELELSGKLDDALEIALDPQRTKPFLQRRIFPNALNEQVCFFNRHRSSSVDAAVPPSSEEHYV